MSSTNIRISSRGRDILRELARKEGQPMGAVLEAALERYRREKFLEDANAAFAALKANPSAWREELAERSLWENTLGDGLEKE